MHLLTLKPQLASLSINSVHTPLKPSMTWGGGKIPCQGVSIFSGRQGINMMQEENSKWTRRADPREGVQRAATLWRAGSRGFLKGGIGPVVWIGAFQV